MSDPAKDELAASRAALAPTLDATAAILPWLARPKAPRHSPALNQRWLKAIQETARCWSERNREGLASMRAAVFSLYATALESNDAQCLALGEALASCVDSFEQGQPGTQLSAAISATLEALDEASGLEHEAFEQRARHFTQRLLAALEMPDSSTLHLQRIFREEACEHLMLMREALAALPVDAYTLATESSNLCIRAEEQEDAETLTAAQALSQLVRAYPAQLDNPSVHAHLAALIEKLGELICAKE